MNDPTGGAGAGEPTELAGVAAADTELVYAWALDDDTDDGGGGSGWWARRVTVAALAVSLLLLAGAGVVAVVFLRDPAPTVVAAPAPSVAAPPRVAEPPGWGLPGRPPPTLKPPPATVTRTRTAPPVTVTATPPPEPPQLPVRPPLTGPLPDLTGHNDAFLARLVDSGWTIWNPALMAQRGQEACAMMRAGEPRELIVSKMLVVEPLLTRAMAHQFLQIASATYPNCP